VKFKLGYRGYRITVVREGWRHWRNYIAGPPGVGGLDLASDSCPVFWALMDAIWTVQDKTRPEGP
jgi:hypothetical protein